MLWTTCPGVALALNNLGILAYEQQNLVRAEALYNESLAIKRQLGDVRGIATTLINLGHVARLQDNPADAEPLYHEHLALRRELKDPWGIAASLINLGHVARLQAQPNHARAFYQQGLGLCQEIGDQRLLIECLKGIVAAIHQLGRAAVAAQVLGATQALRVVIDTSVPPIAQAAYARLVAAVQRACGSAVWDASTTQGAARSFAEATASAERVLADGAEHNA